ncbi:class I adenylate-forming enzyme family protein [Natrarchaeobius sp. A-rgal3]|uniref:class I adenylate-forming enzyme family protein n=1 Tax=Natrarchaeobius versutus TaxID=1679078 RepID=UPI0035109780
MHTYSTPQITTVKDLSTIAAESNPDSTAFVDEHRRVTWPEFDSESKRAANAFQDHLAQGDRVAFICESSVDHMATMVGAMKAGAIPSNLHLRASPETFRYCIDTIRPRVIVLDEEYSEFFEERVSEKITTDLSTVVTLGEPRTEYEQSLEEFVAEQPETEPDVRVQPEDIAAIWWTSGTTGRPKGWCHTNRGITLKAMMSSSTSDRLSRSLTVLSPGFAAWWGNTISTLLTGQTVVFRRNWDPEEVARLIEDERITHVGLVTTMWREILELDRLEKYDLSSLEEIFSTGEKLDKTTVQRLEKNICERICNGYSSTEIHGTQITNEEMDGDRVESVGKPLLGQRIRIVEEDGDPTDTLDPGEVGEIIIKGPDAPVWAWGDTGKTENAFDDGWWRSGDLGYKDEDGYLYIEGRSDFMITSKGIKVFPAPVEERLNAHPDVEDAVIVGVSDEEYGERVTAIVARSDPSVSSNQLDEWCLESDKLARFERPRVYEFIDGPINRTASGKLDRQSAKEQHIDE